MPFEHDEENPESCATSLKYIDVLRMTQGPLIIHSLLDVEPVDPNIVPHVYIKFVLNMKIPILHSKHS